MAYKVETRTNYGKVRKENLNWLNNFTTGNITTLYARMFESLRAVTKSLQIFVSFSRYHGWV